MMIDNYFKVFRIRPVVTYEFARVKPDEHYFFFDSGHLESIDQAAHKAMACAARFAAEEIPHSLCIARRVEEYGHVDVIGEMQETQVE